MTPPEPESGSDPATERLHIGRRGHGGDLQQRSAQSELDRRDSYRKHAADTDGLYIAGIGQGFSFTAPADTTLRTLVVHVGGWNSGGMLTAVLSDGSASSFTDTPAPVNGQYDRNYTLTYQAGGAGQTLTVTWKMTSGTGNVTLNAAALH